MMNGRSSATCWRARSRLKSRLPLVKIGVSGELTYFASRAGSSAGVS